MTYVECSKISIEYKKFYYDLHSKKLIKCSAFLVVGPARPARELPSPNRVRLLGLGSSRVRLGTREFAGHREGKGLRVLLVTALCFCTDGMSHKRNNNNKRSLL
jgi:hypothetical protein